MSTSEHGTGGYWSDLWASLAERERAIGQELVAAYWGEEAYAVISGLNDELYNIHRTMVTLKSVGVVVEMSDEWYPVDPVGPGSAYVYVQTAGRPAGRAWLGLWAPALANGGHLMRLDCPMAQLDMLGDTYNRLWAEADARGLEIIGVLFEPPARP